MSWLSPTADESAPRRSRRASSIRSLMEEKVFFKCSNTVSSRRRSPIVVLSRCRWLAACGVADPACAGSAGDGREHAVADVAAVVSVEWACTGDARRHAERKATLQVTPPRSEKGLPGDTDGIC